MPVFVTSAYFLGRHHGREEMAMKPRTAKQTAQWKKAQRIAWERKKQRNQKHVRTLGTAAGALIGADLFRQPTSVLKMVGKKMRRVPSGVGKMGRVGWPLAGALLGGDMGRRLVKYYQEGPHGKSSRVKDVRKTGKK